MLVDLTVATFFEQTASKAPVPGGGSMAALNGAVAASLVEMVAGLTIGRKGFEAVSERMTELAERAKDSRRRMLRAVDRDAAAFGGVMQAFAMPVETAVQRRQRSAAVQEAFKEAVRIPLTVAEEALKLLQMAAEAAENGNPNAVTDGVVGVLAARTAVLGALLNVRVNLNSIRDEKFVAATRTRAEALESEALDRERRFLALLAL